MSTKRSRAITLATAGTLALATAISLAATLPAASSPAAASADAAYTSTTSQQATAQPSGNGVAQAVMFARMRSIEAARHQQELAAQKAAKAKASAAKAAAQVAAVKSSGRAAAARPSAAQAAKKAQPAQQAAAITPSGSPEQVAERMLSQFGWSSGQFSCLQPLWEHESGWSVTAENPASGAYGIPQSLPASKMATAGSDWMTNANTQINWGLDYISRAYGSPCGAWAHEVSHNWY